MIAAIDAMVLIWFLRKPHFQGKPAGSNVAEMEQRAFVLIENLASQDAAIVVPAVAAAEFLLGVHRREHGQLLAEMTQRFMLFPFDVAACPIAARLWQDAAEESAKSQPKNAKVEQQSRVCLKADVLVVATAKAAGATVLFSNDKRVRSLAQMVGLEGRDLPTHSENLFIDLEAKKLHQPEGKGETGGTKPKR